MKIRIKNNSVRMRLSRLEVARFGADRYIECRTEFGNAVFIYAIRCDNAIQEISADLSDNKITMHIPLPIAEEFVHTDVVGFQQVQIFATGEKLFLLFEKDFKCVDAEVTEDQSDNYENPSAICNQ